jgi:hypothetical protein
MDSDLDLLTDFWIGCRIRCTNWDDAFLRCKNDETLKFWLEHSQEISLIVSHNIINCACEFGSIEVLNYWWDNKESLKWHHYRGANTAFVNGHFHIMKWWEDRKEFLYYHISYDSSCLCTAMSMGNIVSLEWWRTHKEMFTTIIHNERILSVACIRNQLNAIQWWFDNNLMNEIACTSRCIDFAAEHDDLVIVKWFWKRRSTLDFSYTKDAIDGAAEHGCLNVLNWFWNKTNIMRFQFNPDCIDTAAINGKLDVIKWFYDRRDEPLYIGNDTDQQHKTLKFSISAHAIRATACNGHLDVLDWLWLCAVRKDIKFKCDREFLDRIAANNHIEVLDWFVDKYIHDRSGILTKPIQYYYSDYAVKAICTYGHTEELDWWYNMHRSGLMPFKCNIRHAINMASIYGNTKILDWFYNHTEFKFQYTQCAVNGAARCGNLESIQWFWDRRNDPRLHGFMYTAHAVNSLCRGYVDSLEQSRAVEVASWFWDRRQEIPFKFTYHAIDNASKVSHIKLIEWFEQHGLSLQHSINAIDCMQVDDDAMLQFWYDRRHQYEFSYTRIALDTTIVHNHLNRIKWWFRNHLNHGLKLLYTAKIITRYIFNCAKLFDTNYSHTIVDSIPDDVCSICIDTESSEFIKLDCNHSFHSRCIERAMLINSNCPYCRTPIELQLKILDDFETHSW